MSLRRQLILFFAAATCMAAATGMHESFFNNFLDDTFAIKADQRGFLEFPRELPGFLVVITTGFLATLSVTRVAAVGAGVFALGMLGMVAFGSVYWQMIAMMVLGSVGMHLLQPIRATIAIALSTPENRGARLGQLGAISTVGTITGCGALWWVFTNYGAHYRTAFLTTSLLGVAAVVLYARMHVPHLTERRARFVMHRRYSLYYALECLFGARKQIFITFGPWVLIQVYGEKATTIATLFIVASVIGIVFRPLVGRLIDAFGERTLLVADGLALCVICLGYGYARWITGDATLARYLVYACFVLDDVLFAVGSARSIYAARIAPTPGEISSTLSVGITINHAVSMTIPTFAGLVWVTLGYEKLFLGAAVFALCISAVSVMVPARNRLREIEAENARMREAAVTRPSGQGGQV